MDIIKIINKEGQQLLILPEAYQIKGTDEVLIMKKGDAIVIIPKLKNWENIVPVPDEISDDFMSKRIQPSVDDRETLF